MGREDQLKQLDGGGGGDSKDAPLNQSLQDRIRTIMLRPAEAQMSQYSAFQKNTLATS